MNAHIKKVYVPMTETSFYILLCLCEETHGYGIVQKVEALTDGAIRISPGTLYGSLSKMEKDELITFCSCQVRNKKKLIFFINGEPLARFPMLLLYNFVFSLLLLIIPSSSLKVIKVPSDFNMLIIIHQHIINEISDYFFIKLIQLTKLC